MSAILHSTSSVEPVWLATPTLTVAVISRTRRWGHVATDSLSQGSRLAFVHVAHGRHNLLTAVLAHAPPPDNTCLNCLGDVTEDLIPHVVSVLIVELL